MESREEEMSSNLIGGKSLYEDFGNVRNLYDQFNSDIKVLSGMFIDRESTERVYDKLIAKGYSMDEISLVVSNRTMQNDFGHWKGTTEFGYKVAANGENSFVQGGTFRTMTGKFTEISTKVVIHGLRILITGPLASKMAGAEANGLVGGLICAFVRAGISEARAKLYYSGIKNGNVIILMTPKDEADGKYLLNNWRGNRGEEVHY